MSKTRSITEKGNLLSKIFKLSNSDRVKLNRFQQTRNMNYFILQMNQANLLPYLSIGKLPWRTSSFTFSNKERNSLYGITKPQVFSLYKQPETSFLQLQT